MNYLQKKRLAIMRNRQFKGYLKSVSGVLPLTVSDGIKGNLVNYIIEGNTVQNGTPTVDEPIEIVSVGNKTKNLLNTESVFSFTQTKDFKDLSLSPGMYTMSYDSVFSDGEEKYTRAYVRFIDNNFGFYLPQLKSHTFELTTTETKVIFYANGYSYVGSSGYSVTINNLMLEMGEEATSYEPYGYKIPIIASGKNLFDVNKWFPDYVNGNNGISYTNDDFKTIYAVKILEGQFKENTQYSISLDYELTKNVDTNFGVIIMFTGSDGSRIVNKRLPDGATQGTYSGQFSATNPIDTSISSIAIVYNISTEDMFVKLSNIQIEEGETATTYESYQEPATTEIYLDELLCGVKYSTQSFADSIDFNTQTLNKQIKKIVLTGDENWIIRGSCTNTFQFSMGYSVYAGFSTHYPSFTSSYIDKQNGVYLLNTGAMIITDMSYDNVEDFKAFLKTQYEAGTPVTCVVGDKNGTIDPINVDLPKIPIFNGTSIYTAETSIQPSGMTVEYYSKTP